MRHAKRPKPSSAFPPSRPVPRAHLLLLVRDPHCLFACWDVNSFTGNTRDATLVLRVYHVPPEGVGPDRIVAERVITQPHGGHYVDVRGSGRRYRARIGWRRGAAFRPIAGSRTVITPPAGPELPASPVPRRRPSGGEADTAEFARSDGELSVLHDPVTVYRSPSSPETSWQREAFMLHERSPRNWPAPYPRLSRQAARVQRKRI